jgi:PiT family inorganic phosphate transporter
MTTVAIWAPKGFLQGKRLDIARYGIALLMLLGVALFASTISTNPILIAAAIIGGYMAINIGANDVANNVGPAVGSKALSLAGAIVIAAIFEAGGAIIAGGDVVSTIKKGIIDPSGIANPEAFVWLMMAALLAGAIWLNIATALGAPVSTTHSIVGGVLGAGIAAAGWEIANWDTMGKIAASWVISPVLGGLIAAGFLYIIKRNITYREDMPAAARKMVPLLVALMSWAFATYLILKGLSKLWKVGFLPAAGIGVVIAVAVFFVVRSAIQRRADTLENNKESINTLFTIPLIFAAGLLSFAHGANDVANAVGPLAAINDALLHGGVTTKAAIPLWIMLIGAIGIAVGLALFGPKLIKTVGTEITELDRMRAFCIAMAASITVIIASQLGLPVSSTHIAVGGVFGVGFLREILKVNYSRMIERIEAHHQGEDRQVVEQYLTQFKAASVDKKGLMIEELKRKQVRKDSHLSKKERKRMKSVYKTELVKRSVLYKIAGAWIITVPVSGTIGAFLFYAIRGFMLP